MKTKTWTAPNGVTFTVGQKVERTPENAHALLDLEITMGGKEFCMYENLETFSAAPPVFCSNVFWPVTITALPEEKKPEPISFEEALALRREGKPVWWESGAKSESPYIQDGGHFYETDYAVFWVANQEGRKFYAENPEGGE